MSWDGQVLSTERLSMDTSTNINDDVAAASEYSLDSRKKSESVLLSLRPSMDGSSNHINSFNILKLASDFGDDKPTPSVLGPNAIFDLTAASDVARIRMNKPLKTHVSINAGADTYTNLVRPTTQDIPQTRLQPLEKVPDARIYAQLVEDVEEEYAAFELNHSALTAAVLSSLSKELLGKPRSISSELNFSEDADSDDIPKVFEDPNFHLDDQRVFNQVMQNLKILPEDLQAESIANNTEVQEKLSQYLDTVEMQLIKEISRTSDSFFTTLGDIANIKQNSHSSVKNLDAIVKQLDKIEQTQAKVGLSILEVLDERKSVNHLESSVIQLKTILDCIAQAHQFHQNNNYIECLDEIFITESLIRGVSHEDYTDLDTLPRYPKLALQPVDFSKLPALENNLRNLANLKKSCSAGYIADFINLLIDDLQTYYRAVPVTETLHRIGRKNTGALSRNYSLFPLETKDLLRKYVGNLAKVGFLTAAFGQYQDKIIAEVKAIIRAGLPSTDPLKSRDAGSADSAGSEQNTPVPADRGAPTSKNGTLSLNIKGLSDQEFIEMINGIITHLCECLRRLTAHQKLLLDLSLTAMTPEASASIDVMSLDITGAINKAIELTQVRLVKVFNVRLEQLGDSSLASYLRLYSVCSAYLQECEQMNPGFRESGPGSSLNEWLRNHVGYYLHKFHNNSVKNLAALCDKEVWREFSGAELASAQTILDEVVAYSKHINGELAFDGSKWLAVLLVVSPEQQESKEPDELDSNKAKLSVGSTDYWVPRMIVDMVQVSADYVKLSAVFPSKASTIMLNLLTFVKVLNSRISQAILNAGATRTAGLKHITTKHLALCIQTIDFLLAYLKIIRDIFKPQEESLDAMSETPTFATAIEYLQDHKKELQAKLISIMHDRTINHTVAVKALDLSKPIQHPLQCHPYMEILVKETLTVGKVLGKYLDPQDCLYIMLEIFENYKKLLVSCYCTDLPQFKDLNEKHSIMKDIDYFRVKLDETPGYGNSGQVIWENVNSLPTVEETRMEQVMKHNIEGERKKAQEEPEVVFDRDAVVEEPLDGTQEENVSEEVKEVQIDAEVNADKSEASPEDKQASGDLETSETTTEPGIASGEPVTVDKESEEEREAATDAEADTAAEVTETASVVVEENGEEEALDQTVPEEGTRATSETDVVTSDESEK